MGSVVVRAKSYMRANKPKHKQNEKAKEIKLGPGRHAKTNTCQNWMHLKKKNLKILVDCFLYLYFIYLNI